jgi:hypothetical protein
MPAAFAIPEDEALALGVNGPEFYLGYLGAPGTATNGSSKRRFWDALADGIGVSGGVRRGSPAAAGTTVRRRLVGLVLLVGRCPIPAAGLPTASEG